MSKKITGTLMVMLMASTLTVQTSTPASAAWYDYICFWCSPPVPPAPAENSFSAYPNIAKQPKTVREEIIDMIKFMSRHGFDEDAATDYLMQLEESYKSSALEKLEYDEFGLVKNRDIGFNKNLVQHAGWGGAQPKIEPKPAPWAEPANDNFKGKEKPQANKPKQSSSKAIKELRKICGIAGRTCLNPYLIIMAAYLTYDPLITTMGDGTPGGAIKRALLKKLEELKAYKDSDNDEDSCKFATVQGGKGEEEAEILNSLEKDRLQDSYGKDGIESNAVDGRFREDVSFVLLKKVFPCEHVLRERYLRYDANPGIVYNPKITLSNIFKKYQMKEDPDPRDAEADGLGRRIDFVIVNPKDGQAHLSLEITSIEAAKSKKKEYQQDKENRIREKNGHFVLYPKRKSKKDPTLYPLTYRKSVVDLEFVPTHVIPLP